MSHKPSDEKVSALLDIGQLNSLIMNCSFSTEESSCSESGVGSAILPLLACKRDMTSHLVSLRISESVVEERQKSANRGQVSEDFSLYI